jgi:hypothetical protein
MQRERQWEIGRQKGGNPEGREEDEMCIGW